MSTLRQEYLKSKTRKEKIVSEAALAWLAKNVIIINEKIDRTTVSRLIDSIQKFEDTFGKFADRLPTISQYLNAAEEGLQQVITGKANDRKASAMLKKLTILYHTFSDFFTRDLPILLRAKVFDAAKEQPDVRLDMIRNRNGMSYDPYVIRDALANALKPTKEEKKLLSKIYRTSLLPKMDVDEIAGQLMTLTFNELEELTKVGKVPLAATPEELEGEEVPEEGLGGGLPGEEIPGAEVPVPESVQGKGELLTEQMITETVNLLLEATVEEVTSGVNALKSIVDSAPALAQLKGPVSDLQSKVLDVMGTGDVKSYLNQIKQAGTTDKKRLLANLFQTPKGKIISQANMAIESFESLAKAYNQVEPILNKENVTQQDLANVRKTLLKALTGGIVQRIKSLFKTEPFPGLSPEEILDAVMTPIDEASKEAAAGAQVDADIAAGAAG